MSVSNFQIVEILRSSIIVLCFTGGCFLSFFLSFVWIDLHPPISDMRKNSNVLTEEPVRMKIHWLTLQEKLKFYLAVGRCIKIACNDCHHICGRNLQRLVMV